MTNQDLDRILNPWMFDASGKLKDSARKQVPDLASAPAPISTGATPGTAGGPALVADRTALRTAGDNATRLGDKLVADCQTPFGDDFSTAASAMRDWAVGRALATAHNVWENQFLNLGGSLITVGSTLHDNATGYTGTEHAVKNHMRVINDR